MSDDPRAQLDALAQVSRTVAAAIHRGRSQGWLTGEPIPAANPTDPQPARQDLADPSPMGRLRQRLALTHTEVQVLWTLVGFDLDTRLRKLLGHPASPSA
jgi:hypothetical protein